MSLIWIYYLILINAWAFFIMGNDKLKAKKKKRRFPERQLLFYAFIGGSYALVKFPINKKNHFFGIQEDQEY